MPVKIADTKYQPHQIKEKMNEERKGGKIFFITLYVNEMYLRKNCDQQVEQHDVPNKKVDGKEGLKEDIFFCT